MKKISLFILAALALLGCSNSGERLLTSATGSIYECLIVSDASVKAAVSETMSGDMYALPQMEPYFTVSHVTAGQFDDLLKATRNILYIDINPQKYTQIKVLNSRNVWSKPQAYIRRDWFVREELARQLQFYRVSTSKEVRMALKKQGYDLLVPEDFILIKNEQIDSVDVIWCCNNKGPMRKDIVVYSYPYTSQEQFSNVAIIATRDAVLGKLITAQVPGSHMGTEFKHFPPVSRSVAALRDSVGGFYAVETRGLWKILDGEAMGGPFVSLTRLDQVNGRVVTAEAFLYAAGQKKRNALRQIEAILYSLKMPNEQTASARK